MDVWILFRNGVNLIVVFRFGLAHGEHYLDRGIFTGLKTIA
jgi:hypothetical protein